MYHHCALTHTGAQVLAKAALEKELTVQKTEVDRLKSQLQASNTGGDSEGGSALPAWLCLPVCLCLKNGSLCAAQEALCSTSSLRWWWCCSGCSPTRCWRAPPLLLLAAARMRSLI